MTRQTYNILMLRYADLVNNAIDIKENEYGELFITSEDGTSYLFIPEEGFVRKLPSDVENMNDCEFAIEFGKRLRARLRYAGVTQYELAQHTGLSQATISSYITGKTIPSFRNIDKIARVLKCSIDDFRYVN